IQSQVIDGDNGFLIEPGSSQELAQKLIYLAANDEERERMGDRSREIAESEFGWGNVTEKYHQIYKKIDD
ncbi:MAG: glycosyltransferase, partial [Halobacteriaceae archaeon]